MNVPDEVVIEALLKDAKRFKSKWELRVGEPTRSTPNLKFLERTLTNVVKVNKDRMRKPRSVERHELFEDGVDKGSSSSKDSSNSDVKQDHKIKRSSRRDQSPKAISKKSRHCSKSKHRSPESRRHRKSKKSKKKRDKSKDNPH